MGRRKKEEGREGELAVSGRLLSSVLLRQIGNKDLELSTNLIFRTRLTVPIRPAVIVLLLVESSPTREVKLIDPPAS